MILRALLLVSLLAPARVVGAQEVPPDAETQAEREESTETRPWEEGISDATRAEALSLFRAANDHFAESEYAQAARGYRAALEVWDHPRIHGNLATALILLDSPLDALTHLRAALVYEEAPFAAHVYQQLQINQRLLLQQLARVTVRCVEDGARVRVDGASREACPGGGTELMSAGNHELVASRSGYLTFTRAFTAVGGTETVIEVDLTPLADAAQFERYWDESIPWLVFGGGLVVGALGVLPLLGALDSRDQFEGEIERSCPSGCLPSDLPPAVLSLADETEIWNGVAMGSFIVGGAAAATGVMLLIVNQERRVDVDESGERVRAVPLVGPSFAGLAVQGGY